MKILFIMNLLIKYHLLNHSERLLQWKRRLRIWNKPSQEYES